MKQIKKTLSIFMAALFVMAGFLGNVTAKAADVVLPAINFVGVEHSPLVVGDTETFTVTSSYEGEVQYRAFLYSEKTDKWTELTAGYTVAKDAKEVVSLPKTSAFELGKYKLSVWVKRAGETGKNFSKAYNDSYDSYYVAYLNCVNKDDANRVYANGDMNVKVDGLKVTIDKIEGISGIEGPYQYRLHYFNPATGEWTKNATEYADKVEYTFPKAGTYVLDVYANTEKSTTWKTYLADKNAEKTRGTYESWKLAVVTVTENTLPTATTKVEAGLTAFDRYVEVTLDTTKSEDYKVTVLGTELKYVAAKGIFQGIIASSDEAAIKAGVVVVSTKVPTVEVKATTKVEAGLTAFDRYVEVTIDAQNPENYKVTVLGTELKYVAAKNIFQGIIASSDEDAIKAGVVVSAK